MDQYQTMIGSLRRASEKTILMVEKKLDSGGKRFDIVWINVEDIFMPYELKMRDGQISLQVVFGEKMGFISSPNYGHLPPNDRDKMLLEWFDSISQPAEN